MTNRIQKLLFSEYSELEELVLLESPFAETKKNGNAIRQVQIGLTPRNIIIATDIIRSANEVDVHYCYGLDPEIETLELISVIPVECVNLSVYNRRKRHTLKARFCNSLVKYYELGGSLHHTMYWNLWCEKVRFLSPNDEVSCLSETSAASSTTGSTLYIKSKKLTVRESGKPTLWCHYGKSDSHRKNVSFHEDQGVWSDKHLVELLPINRSVLRGTSLTEIRVNFDEPFQRKSRSRSHSSTLSKYSIDQPNRHLEANRSYHINRFGEGIPENCLLGLYLHQNDPDDEGDTEQPHSSRKFLKVRLTLESMPESAQKLCEEAIQIWERGKEPNKRHFRRYGFCPYPSFLNGFSMSQLTESDFYSVQIKQAVSSLSLTVPRNETGFNFPISKCNLTLSVSLDALSPRPRFLDTCHSRSKIFFWTPGYQYCPVTFHRMYHMLQKQLQKIHIFLNARERGIRKSLLNSKKKITRTCDASTLKYLKQKLKMKSKISIWNFNSTVLAYQLTMVDKDLFCKIEEIEIEILQNHCSVHNAPNIAAIIAFSHRISCLVATDILQQESEKGRSLLIVRFINVAEKCDILQNFQSCHSVLEGLQSPAIHRLHTTWTRVRKEYPSKYWIFEKLCRKHRDPRLPGYQKAFYKASLKPPFLPYIGDILARAAERVPNFPIEILSKNSQERMKNLTRQQVQKDTMTDLKKAEGRVPEHSAARYFRRIRQLLSFLHIISVASTNSLLDNKTSDFVHSDTPSGSKFNLANGEKQNFNSCCLLSNGDNESQFKHYSTGYTSSSLQPNYYSLKVGGIIHLLDWYKRGAMSYDFTIDKLARDYLLKSHYQEESKNFNTSILLETTVKCNVNG